MSFSDDDLQLLICMFEKGAIMSRHFPVEALARFCRTTARILKRQLKRLARDGYVERHKTKSYSLSKDGVIIVRQHLDI